MLKAHLTALAYVALIYAFVPVANIPMLWLRERNLLRLTMFLMGVVAFFALTRFLRHHLKLPPKEQFRILILTGAAAWGLSFLVTHPQEWMHLLMYGGLPAIWIRAFETWPRKFAYPMVLALSCLAGYGEEVVQHYTPERYFDWMDVALNGLSSLMGTTLVGRVELIQQGLTQDRD